jgi:hypothetical protein
VSINAEVERIYGGRKHYVKMHFVVDIRTKEVVAMDVATDGIHDSKVLPSLMMDAQDIEILLRLVWMDRTIQGKHIGFSRE